MNKNLLWKLIAILGVLLVFLFGIFGIPQSFSGQGLLSAMTNRIHLGPGFARWNPSYPASASQ